MTSPFHIFICFSSKDETVARAVVDFLEADGLRCWISVRDVPAGQNYQETIVKALEQAKGLVFLFSEASGGSGEIKKELSLAGAMNAPVFPLRLAPIQPTGALRYELATRQWIDLFPDRQRALRKLAETIRTALDAPAEAKAEQAVVASAPLATVAAPASEAPARAKKRAKRAPIVAPDSPQFEAIRALLAHHVGPIAKILVQKAATDARTPEEFCEKLAAHVSAPPGRAAFLQAVRAQLSPKP